MTRSYKKDRRAGRGSALLVMLATVVSGSVLGIVTPETLEALVFIPKPPKPPSVKLPAKSQNMTPKFGADEKAAPPRTKTTTPDPIRTMTMTPEEKEAYTKWTKTMTPEEKEAYTKFGATLNARALLDAFEILRTQEPKTLPELHHVKKQEGERAIQKEVQGVQLGEGSVGGSPQLTLSGRGGVYDPRLLK